MNFIHLEKHNLHLISLLVFWQPETQQRHGDARGIIMQTDKSHFGKKRPIYLDMPTIIKHLPMPAIVSILHRASGVVLFLMLPFLLALLSGSRSSGEDFEYYKAWADNWFIKLILWAVLWAFIHHLFAGIRFLLIDAHIGVNLKSARHSSKIVLIGAAATAFVLGIALW